MKGLTLVTVRQTNYHLNINTVTGPAESHHRPEQRYVGHILVVLEVKLAAERHRGLVIALIH